MIYFLSEYLISIDPGFGVLKYLTLRAVFATLTALGFSLLFGPMFIRRLTSAKVGQQVRTDGPQTHLEKHGTPTMGGALILLSILFSALLWGDLSSRQLWVVIFVTAAFGAIGWVDDYRKVVKRQSEGLTPREKMIAMFFAGLAAALFLFYSRQSDAEITLLIPVFKNYSWQMGVLFIPFVWLVIVGSSNAVNLTDGLDGLAIMPTVLVAGALGIFAYVAGNKVFSSYLDLPFILGAGEVLIICAAIAGAGLGFLWFNTYPAQVFMGDVGALALGAALGSVAVVVRQELVYFIMAGVFVMEALSVIIQVSSFKLTGKRVFRMAPLHHHFELKGWPEPRVIVRFWIVTVVLVLVGLATLKIR